MSKDEKIQELLAVLELPEDEQWEWALTNEHRNTYRESLGDLAFRLRDETVYLKRLEKRDSGDYNIEHRLYRNAMVKVYDYLNNTSIFNRITPPQKYFIWWIETAKPIHWIIAALISKELIKNE